MQAVALPAEASSRVRMLSDKVKRRAYQNAMNKAGAIQKRSQEAIGKLIHTIDLVCISHDDSTISRVAERSSIYPYHIIQQ